MFTDRYFGKKQGKDTPASAPSVDEPRAFGASAEGPSLTSETGEILISSDPAEGPVEGSSEDLGLPLEDFAARSGVSEAEVWRRLRRGELIGRTQRGRLTIYASLVSAQQADSIPLSEPAAPLRAGASIQDDLPPLPRSESTEPQAEPIRGATSLAPPHERHHQTTEMALLLDHLSLAKEENREILRMTQESIRKVTELTDTIVEMKDAVIEAKDTQIVALREQLETRERDIKRLLQQKEDLEMLARTMAEDAASRIP